MAFCCKLIKKHLFLPGIKTNLLTKIKFEISQKRQKIMVYIPLYIQNKNNKISFISFFANLVCRKYFNPLWSMAHVGSIDDLTGGKLFCWTFLLKSFAGIEKQYHFTIEEGLN